MPAESGSGGPPPHGRYYAEYVRPIPGTDFQVTVQEALDAGDRKEWHLAGASNSFLESDVIFFWDTGYPSFGRSQFRPR
jgi:hypothetical protein